MGVESANANIELFAMQIQRFAREMQIQRFAREIMFKNAI